MARHCKRTNGLPIGTNGGHMSFACSKDSNVPEHWQHFSAGISRPLADFNTWDSYVQQYNQIARQQPQNLTLATTASIAQVIHPDFDCVGA